MVQSDPINVIIVDDEISAVESLTAVIERFPEVNILDYFLSSKKALDFLSGNSADIVFLDVDMPGMNGFDFIKELRQYNRDTTIIFVTGYAAFSIEAIKCSAFDYLIKPVDTDEFQKTLRRFKFERILNQQKLNMQAAGSEIGYEQKIRIKSNTGFVLLDPIEIVYLEADGNYTYIHQTDGSKYTATLQLGMLESLIPPKNFCRISRKHIVNIRFISGFDKRKRELLISSPTGKHHLPVSESRVRVIEQLF